MGETKRNEAYRRAGRGWWQGARPKRSEVQAACALSRMGLGDRFFDVRRTAYWYSLRPFMLRAFVVVVAVVRAAYAECPGDKRIAVARGSIAVDGVLDDVTWNGACFVEDLVQKQPAFGANPTHPAKVAVAIDHDTLYVGARMWSGPSGVVDDALTQRDDTSQAERFVVSFDPSRARRRAYSFVASLRSTAVLRWEPAPGSALFVVWQQQRGGDEAARATPLRSVLPDIFTQSAIHTLAIKLSYWFG